MFTNEHTPECTVRRAKGELAPGTLATHRALDGQHCGSCSLTVESQQCLLLNSYVGGKTHQTDFSHSITPCPAPQETFKEPFQGENHPLCGEQQG